MRFGVQADFAPRKTAPRAYVLLDSKTQKTKSVVKTSTKVVLMNENKGLSDFAVIVSCAKPLKCLLFCMWWMRQENTKARGPWSLGRRSPEPPEIQNSQISRFQNFWISEIPKGRHNEDKKSAIFAKYRGHFGRNSALPQEASHL